MSRSPPVSPKSRWSPTHGGKRAYAARTAGASTPGRRRSTCATAVLPSRCRCCPAASPARVRHRTWEGSWVAVSCAACGTVKELPQPELGCGCGTLLRLPVAPPALPGGRARGGAEPVVQGRTGDPYRHPPAPPPGPLRCRLAHRTGTDDPPERGPPSVPSRSGPRRTHVRPPHSICAGWASRTYGSRRGCRPPASTCAAKGSLPTSTLPPLRPACARSRRCG